MKLLVVRFSSIGDIVLTTPVVRAISEQLKDVEIHYLTKKKFKTLLDGNEYITKIYTIESSIDEILPALKNENYTAIIDLHNNVRTLALKKKLGVKAHVFPKLNLKKWLLVKMNINKMPDLHVVDRYFKAVEPLGVKNNGAQCTLALLDETVDVKSELGVETGNYLTFAIGAQFETKRMPYELLKNIVSGIDERIVLIGGETDIVLASKLMELNQGLVNAVGKYTIKQSASIVAQSKKLLTNDTGMMHIATCFNVPIVSVWGNTVPELGMYPYYPNKPELYSIHQVDGLSCRPCSKIGFKECPKGHFRCMMDQNIEEIIKDLKH